ncbi:MAG TPA: nucleotidyltransferase [Candidatus Nanoarchaeia archaeon]|nr:nucleotidyltransferase [Candidatus Nanoarchaeia archaeon]
MITFDEQLEFFKLIGGELKEKAECCVIGGSAMMFYNAKAETKDVDLVFMEQGSLDRVKQALHNLGFEDKKESIVIFKRYESAKTKPVMMVKGEERFDLFLKEVITFKMSDAVMERVKEAHEFDNLIVKVASPEDIILLKCATERAKDRDDASSLIKLFNINWETIINESIYQSTATPYLFPVFLFDFLYELKEDLKADIPKEVLFRIRKLSEELMIKKMKSRKGNKVNKKKIKNPTP